MAFPTLTREELTPLMLPATVSLNSLATPGFWNHVEGSCTLAMHLHPLLLRSVHFASALAARTDPDGTSKTVATASTDFAESPGFPYVAVTPAKATLRVSLPSPGKTRSVRSTAFKSAAESSARGGPRRVVCVSFPRETLTVGPGLPGGITYGSLQHRLMSPVKFCGINPDVAGLIDAW